MFCIGVLIRIASNVRLTKEADELKIITDFKLTKKPEYGIFVKYKNNGDCIINSQGQNWTVKSNMIRIVENHYG